MDLAEDMPSSSSAAAVYTEELVCKNIINLYTNSSFVKEANEYLMRFQQESCAWPICISILNRYTNDIQNYVKKFKKDREELMDCSPSSLPPDCTVAQCVYFASQTLCAQAQAGFPQQLAMHPTESVLLTMSELRNGICNLIYNFRGGPKNVVRQMSLALCGCFIFSFHFSRSKHGDLRGGLDDNSCESHRSCRDSIHTFDAVEYVINAFSITNDGLEPLAEILTELASEIFNSRLCIPSEERDLFIKLCLSRTDLIWKTAMKIYLSALEKQKEYLFNHPNLSALHKSHVCSSFLPSKGSSVSSCHPQHIKMMMNLSCPSTIPLPSPLMRSALRCFAAWLNAHYVHAHEDIAQRADGRKSESTVFLPKSEAKQESMADFSDSTALSENEEKIITLMLNCKAVDFLLSNLISGDIDMLQVCTDALICLTNFLSPKTESKNQLMNKVIEEIHLSFIDPLLHIHEEIGGVKAIDPHRLKLITNLLTELSKVHLPSMLYFCPAVKESLYKIFVFVVKLLKHTDLNVKIDVLDFWYVLLTHHTPAQNNFVAFTNVEDQANVIAQNEAEREIQRLALEKPYEMFVSELMTALEFPVDVNFNNEFNFESFQNYRDECAMCLTESTLVLGHHFTLKKSGERLVHLVQEAAKGNTVLWTDIEACLFVLTTVAPRAPAGADEYIPMALEIIPQLPYPSEGVAAFILRAAAGRLVLWTAGFIGSQQALFAILFKLLACDLLPFAVNFRCENEIVSEQKNHTECVLVEAINALICSAGQMLVKEGKDEDITVVLNALTSLIICNTMSLENRAYLLIGAGSVLSFLSKEKIEMLHLQLIEPLAGNLKKRLKMIGVFEDNKYESKTAEDEVCVMSLNECIKLFFTALQAVRPIEMYAAPPLFSSLESLTSEAELNHPVLNVLQVHWNLVEKIILNSFRIEGAIEQACHSLTNVFFICKTHAPGFVSFYSFLDCLTASFTRSPTVYHLGALRTFLGLFSSLPPNTPAITALCNALESCVVYTLNKLKDEGSVFVLSQPDLVGMSFDCVNNALLHSQYAERIFMLPWFITLFQIALQLTPNCHHPKVLHTGMVLLSRVSAWIDPPPHLYSYQPGKSVSWLEESCIKCQNFVSNALMNNFNVDQDTYLQNIFNSVIQAVVNVHTGVQTWIGSATQAVLPLLISPIHSSNAKIALKKAMNNISPDLLPRDRCEYFCNELSHANSPRFFSNLLLKVADEAKGQWKKSQYKINF